MAFTYPGVYIEELPSSVRTIAGVGTSIGLFVGRTTQGPMNTPTRIVNATRFGSAFSWDDPGGDLPRAVRLFFANGGSDCYVMRIANGAKQATVTLNTEASTLPNTRKPSMLATAKSAGVFGSGIRLAVNYKTLIPESTFNLEVFVASQDAQGNIVKNQAEVWTGLSMDPKSARYAVDYVTQNSSLIALTDATGGGAPAATGISQGGRAVLLADWPNILGSTATTNKFRISVDAAAFVDVDLSGLVLPNTAAAIANAIQGVINSRLRPGSTVTVTIGGGPQGNAAHWLTIASANGDVLVQPAGDHDLAVPMMLGSAQGGIEISRYALYRPAASGMVFDIKNLAAFSGAASNGPTDLVLDGLPPIALNNLLQTGGADMFQDSAGGSDGVREKWGILANLINGTGLPYTADVWGSRLAVIPNAPNAIGTIATGGTDIGTWFNKNVRFQTVGLGGAGLYQSPGQAGDDGVAPQASDYQAAYAVVDSQVDLFNLLVLPTDSGQNAAQRAALWGDASNFCVKRRAFLIIDSPPEWKTTDDVTNVATGINKLRIGVAKDHAAVFFPWLTITENGAPRNVGPAGAIAGLMARTDASPGGGVWTAPAGTNADIRGGIAGLTAYLSNDENGLLNPHGINALRQFPVGIVNWGARTMDGDDDFGSQWKYIPIRRLALFIEESLYRGTQWVVFQGNDEALWAVIRLNVGVFMHNLFSQGAFFGTTPQQSYFVKCDNETTTDADVNLGIVNIVVGFRPLPPAEFVVIKIQQMAGQLAT